MLVKNKKGILVFGCAIYQCESCRKTWSEPVGPTNGCPKCRYIFNKWINFNWWQGQYEKFLLGANL